MGERAPIGGGGVTFGAKRKAQRQPSFVSRYGDAISPSHWISPKASVLPGEVNPAKTTPDGVASPPQPQGGVGQRTGSQGPTNNLGTDHTALTSLATSPEQKKKKIKSLGVILAHSASPRTSSPPTGATGTPRGLTQPLPPIHSPQHVGGQGDGSPLDSPVPFCLLGTGRISPWGPCSEPTGAEEQAQAVQKK